MVLPAIFVAWVGIIVGESITLRKDLSDKVFAITVLRDVEESVSKNNELAEALKTEIGEIKPFVSIELFQNLTKSKSSAEKETLDLIRADVRQLRVDLNTHSIRLDQLWNQVSVLGILACLVAILSAVLGWKFLQRSQLVKQKNDELEATTIELQEANTSKNQLFAIIGHDLRSPVGTLTSMLDMLDQDMITAEEFMANVAALRKGVDGVQFTLNNLLHWAKSQLEGINPEFKNVSLAKTVENATQLLESQADKKAIKLDVDVDQNHVVMGDVNHVELVTRNLLANAIKYSYMGGTIRIESSLSNGSVRLSIVDQGVGLTKEEIEEILGEEGKSKLGTMGEKGTGLGILLCKEFIEKNKGTLNAYSDLGKGSTFYLELPAAN